MFTNTPRLPRAILHKLEIIQQKKIKGPGGQSMQVDDAVTTFNGAVLPISNKDWKMLPEGTFTKDSQKLYTDDDIELTTGQIVRDPQTGQRYTVKVELNHNTIHPLLRYIVEGVVGK